MKCIILNLNLELNITQVATNIYKIFKNNNFKYSNFGQF